MDAGVCRPAVGDGLAVPLDHVLEAEAGAADVPARRADAQPVVEMDGHEVADVRLDRERLDPSSSQCGVAAGVSGEVVDPGDLEPDEVGGVVGDALRVGLGEADLDLRSDRISVRAGSVRAFLDSAVLPRQGLVNRRKVLPSLMGGSTRMGREASCAGGLRGNGALDRERYGVEG